VWGQRLINELGPEVPPEGPVDHEGNTNIALLQRAIQSSDHPDYPASNAVDGVGAWPHRYCPFPV
jgi:hypothetical protein